MKKKVCLLLAAILLFTLLTGCGAADSSTDSTGSDSYGGYEAANGEMGFDSSTAASEESGGETRQSGDKIIRTADLSLETLDFDSAAQGLGSIVEELGGYFESQDISNRGAYPSGSYVIRVPAEQFETFCSQAGQLCHLLDMSTSEQNVSEAYYDVEARLTTQQTKLARLQELLSRAEDMADIITIENAISETELEIEYLTGSLRSYDAKIDYATISVYLQEVYRLSNTEEPAVSFGGRLIAALGSGLRSGIDAFEAIVLFLASIWVFLVILAAAAVIAVAVLRRRRRRELEQSAPKEEVKKT